jgi:hypothetical protein
MVYLLRQVFVANADHRPVFEVTAGIRRDAGWLAVQMVKQLTLLGDDPRVIPLSGFNLHDDHAAGRGSHSTNPSRSQLSK